MRILAIAIFTLVGYSTTIYAEETSAPVVEQKNIDSNDNLGDDSARISLCEKEIQQLVGRVEILEHTIHELQKHQAASANSQMETTAPGITPVGLETTVVKIGEGQADSTQEKRDYDTALAALKESHFNEAENMFDSFMQKYPKSNLISNAYFWYAESFYRRGDFDKAAVHYLKGYKQFPKAAKAGDSLLKLALSLGEIKKTKEACTILAKLEDEFKQRPASSIKRAYDAKMKYGCK